MTTEANLRESKTWLIWLSLGVILFLAMFLRLWQLDSVPPGWRDDELINSLVISQHVLDGDLAVYYADASGHEALYHILNAFMLGLFGPGVAGIRWLSVILGVLSVVLTFLLANRLYGPLAALVAAATLAVSFWSLMYSRIGLRHILLPVLTLAAYFFFIRGLDIGRRLFGRPQHPWLDFLLAAVFMGLSFYSYFASRGVPLVLMAFLVYVFLFDRSKIGQYWRQLLVMFGLAFLMAIPLLVTLSRQPESEARVAELAVPLVEARSGNFTPLQDHVVTTLSMFHNTGDGEWLYNIPGRPVFAFPAALFFWSGVLIALIFTLQPVYHWLFRRQQDGLERRLSEASLSSAFVLIWWLAGISPAFISVPPASLGHTILAQPVVYMIAALPVWLLAQRLPRERLWIAAGAGLFLVFAVAARDLPDYFVEWPQRGMTRFLYRADIHDVARYLNENPDLQDFSISGLLAGPWDKLALEIGLDRDRAQTVHARWYDPQRALVLWPETGFAGYPLVETAFAMNQTTLSGTASAGGYRLTESHGDNMAAAQKPDEPLCFQNGLCWTDAYYDRQNGILDLQWAVGSNLELPLIPLISNPPPPGIYAGPRLLVFAQLQDAEGSFLVGDDGLWVDPQTLRNGDRFVQRHQLPAADDLRSLSVVFGLYDPLTGERILTLDGRDHIRLNVAE